MVDRIVTGAHYGLRDWLVQRVTAVLMVAYTLFIAGYVVLHSRFESNIWIGLDYNTWTGLFSNLVMRSFSLLFLFAVFFHAWIGVRDIVMDYVKSARTRLVIYVLVIMALLLYSIWAVQILWGM
ncbi:succinate dehydrogenase, hydrophobic membrane anchor protein [Candidatus Nitrotoga arctica]|uniref:Succinate dehydrogenase hydrophobic membrane anchor subunit n=1 Tax=Candidatus Nitrotoga arctica TaxID=453162 RepID=A0ABN8ALH0_9PROT|nr:succinate dehydrogenase, hydrophobic membrane anchor protein [Candidatus Nitrotoga arctica]CAG9933651.1 Succinate dehydrogenase hydrophobic membrane anchor protein [Candidatus Nitrotoga arctica]